MKSERSGCLRTTGKRCSIPGMEKLKKKAPVQAKRGRGRPTKFKPEMVELVRKFCLLGVTNARLAEFLDVSVATIDKWIADDPIFSGAIKEGRELADARISDSLYHRAMGYSHPEDRVFCNADGQVTTVKTIKHYPPDTAAAFIWLKNRHPQWWRDRKEITGPGGGPIPVATAQMSAKALSDLYARTIRGE